MISCPKCEARLHDGSRKCPLCGTPLSLMGFFPQKRPDPVLDPLLDLFERDEVIRYCMDCENEFPLESKRCRPCRRELKKESRSVYEEHLNLQPLQNWGAEVAPKPLDIPPDLVRVKVAIGLPEAKTWLNELRFVGLDPIPGSDALDPFDDPGFIGLYVRAGDEEAAGYMLDGLKPKDPWDKPPSKAPEESDATRLTDARTWVDLGKFREALRVCEALSGNPEAESMRIEALLRSGRRKEALTVAERATDHPELGARERGRLLAQAGVVAALAFDGTPFGEGSRVEEARSFLDAAVLEAPRVLEVGKIRVEILQHQKDTDNLREEMRRLERLNPNLVSRDGHFRRLRDALSLR